MDNEFATSLQLCDGLVASQPGFGRRPPGRALNEKPRCLTSCQLAESHGPAQHTVNKGTGFLHMCSDVAARDLRKRKAHHNMCQDAHNHDPNQKGTRIHTSKHIHYTPTDRRASSYPLPINGGARHHFLMWLVHSHGQHEQGLVLNILYRLESLDP